MIIDTIFLCFCEDSEENDGIDRPYFMSRELMEFVEGYKKVRANNRQSANQNNQIETIRQNNTA